MENNTIQNEPQKKSSKKGIIIAVIGIVVAALILVGALVVFPAVSESLNEKNQLAADEVIAMIDTLDGKKITPESEDAINEIKTGYDNLSKKQKELVSNSELLEKALTDLQNVKEKAENDQIAADEVIGMIDTLKDKTITAENEKEVMSIKAKYDALTTDQKALVTNYTVLVIAQGNLTDAQDKEIALELVKAIDDIDESSLGTDAKPIEALLSRFDALTDNQKLLVTNYDKLLEYEQTVKKNAEKQAKKDKGIALANNFPGYTGKWRDFGAHKSSNQGMIESAVKAANVLRSYFICDPNPNYLDMYVSRFTKDTSGFGIASCDIQFSGYSKADGTYSTLYGEVVINHDGSLYYTVRYFY